MRCEECGKEIRRAANHQRFCNDDCRYAYHNRKKRDAAEDANREQYRREVAAHEARLNGYTLIGLVANPPPQLKGPTLGVLPVRAQPKKQEEKDQQSP
jgi:hypothetical protein